VSEAKDSTAQVELTLVDVRDQDRYDVSLADHGSRVAKVTYRMGTGWIALLHTEVQPGFEGQGMVSRTATLVFDDARSRELKIIPKCPFILRWLERHPEQHDTLLRPLAGPDGALGTSGRLDMS